jgi:adenosylcobinamide-GDP ribazoletransferase
VSNLWQICKDIWLNLAAALIFYTVIPLPHIPDLNFQGVSRMSPIVGLIIAGILALWDAVLGYLGMPILTRSALVVGLGIVITGGLHLDGAMDTADGLAVGDPQRRLAVMTDSATGAFGAMAAVAILLLKTAALTDIETQRWLALMIAAGWGRWGQVVAIAFYPYLKPTGKGAFHKEAIRPLPDILLGFFLLLGLCSFPLLQDLGSSWEFWEITVGGFAIALFTGAWFHLQLGGHTGDTYGAVVEWTEALFLCWFTIIGGV